jgi:membrane-associated HD superfamily phosphohydrolase
LFLTFYLLSILTGVVTGWLRFSQLTTPYRLLTGLLTYTFLSEAISAFLLKPLASPVYKNFNYVLYSFVFISIVSLFQHMTTADKRFKKIIVLQYIIVAIYILINSRYMDYDAFPSTQLIVMSFALIILSLYRLNELAENATESAITSIPDFYASCAYLIFFLLSITLWVQIKYFPKASKEVKVFFEWFFNIVCYIYYAILAYAIHLDYRNSKKTKRFG